MCFHELVPIDVPYFREGRQSIPVILDPLDTNFYAQACMQQAAFSDPFPTGSVSASSGHTSINSIGTGDDLSPASSYSSTFASEYNPLPPKTGYQRGTKVQFYPTPLPVPFGFALKTKMCPRINHAFFEYHEQAICTNGRVAQDPFTPIPTACPLVFGNFVPAADHLYGTDPRVGNVGFSAQVPAAYHPGASTVWWSTIYAANRTLTIYQLWQLQQLNASQFTVDEDSGYEKTPAPLNFRPIKSNVPSVNFRQSNPAGGTMSGPTSQRGSEGSGKRVGTGHLQGLNSRTRTYLPMQKHGRKFSKSVCGDLPDRLNLGLAKGEDSTKSVTEGDVSSITTGMEVACLGEVCEGDAAWNG
ncbi:hypothetical protein MMC25_007378 [Agyrium rufum]|nr:hypothetical protein [Agyrium rufum]